MWIGIIYLLSLSELKLSISVSFSFKFLSSLQWEKIKGKITWLSKWCWVNSPINYTKCTSDAKQSTSSLSSTSNQTFFPFCLCPNLFCFASGPEHQPVDGGAGPADVQGPTVCPGHGEPDESGGRKVEGGLGKPPQPKSKGVSGNWPSVVTESGAAEEIHHLLNQSLNRPRVSLPSYVLYISSTLVF